MDPTLEDPSLEQPVEEDLLLHLPFEERVESKNWKVRAKAYESFETELQARMEDASALRHLGTMVCKMTTDSNPNCLDCGLDGVLMYFDKVEPSISNEILEKVANNVIEKAMGSRPSTIAKAKSLVQIMIEAHEPNTVVPILLSKLSDKKPKIPPVCMELILDGITSYGASKFPVKEILKSMPTALNSTNAPLRDFAMKALVEIHRWIGISPLMQIVEALRPAQKTDFEKQIGEATEKPVPTKLLRSDKAKGIDLSKTAAVETDARDFVDEIDIAKKVKNTEFATLLASEKWVDQNQALQLLIDNIGPTPKIKPSPYIHDILKTMHEFLKNGHLQVQVKVLKVISLLADGLRGKFTPDIRPMMSTILSKTKEKKICSEVESTCITLFKFSVTVDGQIEDMVEILSSKKNPPHAKTSIAVILQHVFNSSIGNLSSDNLKLISDGLIANSEDSDPKVRDDSAKCLAALCKCEKYSDYAQQLLRQLKATNPRLHKKVTLEIETQPGLDTTDAKKSTAKPPVVASSGVKASAKLEGTTSRLDTTRSLESTIPNRNALSDQPSSKASTAPAKKKSGSNEGDDIDSIEELVLSPEEAVEHLTNVCSLDCANISTLLGSAKWQEKVDGIGLIKTYGESNELEYRTVASCVTFFGQQTSNYKISNINVLKALIECFSSLLKSCKDGKSCRSVVIKLCDIVADKFGDKKIQPSVEDMLNSARVAVGTPLVIKKLNKCIESSKSPAVQQSYLQWIKDLITQNGVGEFPVLSTVPMLLKCLDNKNATIRTASIETLGILYSNLGPPLLSFINQKDLTPQLRSTLEAEFQRVGFVPSENKSNGIGSDALPRKDIMEVVDKNVLAELNTIEGKDSWQIRRTALEKVLTACEGSGHYLDYSKSIPELLKVLKARLYDTQSNLKPIAASVIAHLIISFEADKAVKVLRQLGSPLLEGLVDNKKQMRDATVAALNLIISLKADQLDRAMFSVIVQLSHDAMNNTIGRQEIIPWFLSNKELFHGDCNELVPHFVGCLQDKVALVRSGAESCLAHLLSHGNITRSSIDKVVMDLAPAAKRAIQLVLDRLVTTERIVSESQQAQPVITEKKIGQVEPTSVQQQQPQPLPTSATAPPPKPWLNKPSATAAAVVPTPKYVTEEAEEEPTPLENREVIPKKGFQATKSIATVVANIQWPSNPKGEDYLGLLAEWQAVRSHQSLEILFGDFNSDGQIQQELSTIITTSPEELPLVAYWLIYNFASYNNPSRLVVFGNAAVRLIKAMLCQKDNANIKLIQSLFTNFLLCYGRSNGGDGVLHQSLQEFIEVIDARWGAKVALETIFNCLDIANSHSKEFCADSLIWLIMNDGIVDCSRSQITQLFQYLNIEVKLATASLRSKWKLLVESILTKVGDYHKLSTILKWEPKDLFVTLNISLVDDQDKSQLLYARNYVQSTVSKVYIAMDVLLSSTADNRAHSYYELMDLLRKLYDSVSSSKEMLLDGHFFLKTAKVTLSNVPGIHQIVAMVTALFVACSSHKEFVNQMEEAIQQAIVKMLISLVQQYDNQLETRKMIELMMTSYSERSSCVELVKAILYMIDTNMSRDQNVATIGTKILLFKIRQSTVGATGNGDHLLVQLLEAMGTHYFIRLKDTSEQPLSFRSTTAALKMLSDLVGNSALHKALTRSNLSKESIVRSAVLKIVSTSDSDGLNTELVSIIKEVTTSIDKVEAVRKLYGFKQSNPNINVDLHLLKLSAAFRNFVEETMQRLASEDTQTANVISTKPPAGEDSNQSQNEAFRLIHNLKKLPSHGMELEELDKNSYSEPIIKEQIRPPPQSPFAKRNEFIMDSLNSLTKSLDIPIDVQKLKTQL